MAARTLSPTARVIAWIADLWIPALWLAVFLPAFGVTWAQGGPITLLRETVDVPAQVLRAVPVSESVGKGVRWNGYRVVARFEHGGREGLATGDVAAVPKDGWVRARVAVHRPDLAVAFVGPGPRFRSLWMVAGVNVLFGILGLAMLLRTARERVRTLMRGVPVRARVVAQQPTRAGFAVRLAYDAGSGPREVELALDRRQAERVLASPVLVHDPTDPRRLLAPGQVAGLRWDEENDAWAPVSWGLLLQRVLPLVAMAAGAVAGLLASGLLPP